MKRMKLILYVNWIGAAIASWISTYQQNRGPE
jgi:hypothetical protein